MFLQLSLPLLSLLCALALSLPHHSADDSPTATIESGLLKGVSTSIPGAAQKVSKYLGVPFAAQPVRFAPPRSPKPWKGVYDATKYAPACIQQFSYPELTRAATIQWFNTPPPPAGESEDCLNLNIYAPASGTNKSVMVWIYGGSLTFGANSLQAYDGSYLAANEDVIVISINYRTNVFGFPGSPELPAEGNNLGFLDQRFALAWIQRNIASFGGNPGSVTIFGESAGAFSVDALITSYPHNAPFHAAILESGQITFRASSLTPYASWNTLAAATSCNTTTSPLSCLRRLPATTIKNITEHLALTFSPIIDNSTLVANRTAARLSGNIAKVPLLEGSNADEGTLFNYGSTNATEHVDRLFAAAPQSYRDLILHSYPIGSPGISDGFTQIAKIDTEFLFQCTGARVARDTKSVGIPTWRYFYNGTFPHLELFPGAGAFHSAEIPLVFGTYQLRAGATALEQRLSRYMQKAWAGFAKKPHAGPGWAQVPNVADLGGMGVVETDVQTKELDGRCALFDPVYDLIQ